MSEEHQITDRDFVENAKFSGVKPDYERVARYVNRRIAARPEITLTELVKRSGGVSGKTWKRLRDAQPVVQPAKLAAMSKALDWTADSIETILYGGEPRKGTDDLSGIDQVVLTLLSQLQERVDELGLRVVELEARAGLPLRLPEQPARE